jgi:tight adherence protein B
MTVLAAVAAALAAALLVRAPVRGGPHGFRRSRWWPAPTAGAVLLLVVLREPGSAVLVLLASGVVVAVLALLGRRSRHRAAAATAARVMETCELLAGELAAGQPPGRALRHAADSWPPLRPVAEAFGLGGDVPAALRAVAARPGARDLRLLAAAWAVAHRTGHGLADAVQRCADSIRSGQATRRLVEGELSSARATVRLVAGLPVLALLMGSGAGGDPVGFLTGHPVGLACLGGGLAFGFAGLWWIEAIAGDVGSVS